MTAEAYVTDAGTGPCRGYWKAGVAQIPQDGGRKRLAGRLQGSVGGRRYRRGGARSEGGGRDELKLVAGAAVRCLAPATISLAEVAAA
jgi:hypothetical protein